MLKKSRSVCRPYFWHLIVPCIYGKHSQINIYSLERFPELWTQYLAVYLTPEGLIALINVFIFPSRSSTWDFPHIDWWQLHLSSCLKPRTSQSFMNFHFLSHCTPSESDLPVSHWDYSDSFLTVRTASINMAHTQQSFLNTRVRGIL